MSRYCTKCGKEIGLGKHCSCTQEMQSTTSVPNSFLKKFFIKIGLNDSSENTETALENEKTIVPDVIKPNEGETPIKQYEIATLRSRIKGNYAKGRLQVTNKRILFRAPGYSYKGKICVQHEFDIEEIAGIEIQKNNRISPLNILLSVLSAAVISGAVASLFKEVSYKSNTLVLLLSLVFGVLCTIPFFVVEKHYWTKLLVMNCGLGAVLGTSGVSNLGLSSFLGGISLNIADFLAVIILCIWLLNMILVSIVPDLILCIKTKGASEAINIRRRQPTTPFKQGIEYTGFSEVVPGKDVDDLATEIGALIDDIQILGDTCIEKWKE